MKSLKLEVKNNIDQPSEKIKVFVVDFNETTDNKKLFVVNCIGFVDWILYKHIFKIYIYANG